MTPKDFTFLSELIKKRSGLALSEDKAYLLETRLRPIARAMACDDLHRLAALLRNDPPEELLCEITEAMTTNESMFFRDQKPFRRLREHILPCLKPALGNRPLAIWSAACSSGQEAYSLAMAVEEERPALGMSYRILATDIDTKILRKAEAGLYSQFEVQRGLPIQLLLKYFEQKGNHHWQVRENLKQLIAFKQQNLLDALTPPARFDIIMCRNVLIYFDEADKRSVLGRLRGALEPHGVLFLGSAETALGLTEELRPMPGEAGIFVPRESSLVLTA